VARVFVSRLHKDNQVLNILIFCHLVNLFVTSGTYMSRWSTKGLNHSLCRNKGKKHSTYLFKKHHCCRCPCFQSRLRRMH